MQSNSFLDLTKFDVCDFESLLNTSFRQIGNTYRSKEHSSYVIKKGHDDVLRFSSYNGDYGNKSLNIYSLAKYLNPSYTYNEICKLLKEPVKSFEPKKELTKNDNIKSEKALIFSDNTTFGDLQTLRYFTQKCNISDFQTLNNFGVFPIESYGKIASNRIKTPFFAYKESNFLGESLKIKDANKTIFQNKVLLKSPQKQYCFGLNHISQINNKKDVVILIVEGEDDVLTVNNNCKLVKAITFGGVTSPFSKDVLSYLDNNFKGAFICFDNDSAGLKGASEQQKKHSLLSFIVNNPLNPNDEKYKDVSDLFRSIKQIVTDKSKQSVEFEMLLTCQINDCVNAYNRELKRIENEKAQSERAKLDIIEKERIRLEAIETEHLKAQKRKDLEKHFSNETLEVTRYISEKTDILTDALLAYDKILLHGNTHTGKTYFVSTLVNETMFCKLGIEKIIYVVPRKFLGNDIVNELSKSVNTSFVDGTAKQSELDHAMTCKIIVVTMDSLPKFDNCINTSLLVLDEIQKNESDSLFRNAPQNILERLNRAKKTLAITATPNIQLYNSLGFKYIRIESKTREKKVNVTFCDFERITGRENKATYKESILHYINANSGKTCVLLNNKTDLEVIKNCLDGKKCVLITSETCESVLENDRIGKEKLKDFDVFLCTSVVDAGVNLRFHISRFITKNDTKVYDAVQLVGRDRTGLPNEIVILNKIKDSEPEQKPIADYQKVLTEAQILADVLNKCPNLININTEKEKFNSLKPMERQYLFWDKIQNQYSIDYFGLANDCYTHPTSHKEYFEALQNYDNAFCNYSVEYLDFNENADDCILNEQKETLKQLEVMTTKIKAQKDESKQKAIELIKEKGIPTVASEVLKFTKNVNLKKDLKPIANFGSVEIDNETRPYAEKQLSKIVNISKFTDVAKTGFLGMSDADFRAFKGVLMTQKELNSCQKMLTPLELKRFEATKSLQKELTKLKVNDVKGIGKYLKAVENSDLYGCEKAQKIDTIDSKMQRIFELFDFEVVEKDGKITGLTLKKQWNLNLIESVFAQDLPVKRHKTKLSEFRTDIIHLEDLIYKTENCTNFEAIESVTFEPFKEIECPF
jgi:hypothetical protein